MKTNSKQTRAKMKPFKNKGEAAKDESPDAPDAARCAECGCELPRKDKADGKKSLCLNCADKEKRKKSLLKTAAAAVIVAGAKYGPRIAKKAIPAAVKIAKRIL